MTAQQEQHFWLISILFWLLGLSSWITITGLFAELSLMVKDLNEGFEIWSYITLIIQLANIGPLLYSFIPRQYKTQQFVIRCGYLIFIFGFLSMIIMSLSWDTTVTIFGAKRSFMLYLTTFGAAICDCMTSIIFWIFVSYFPTQYMAILGAGEASSGVICAILIYIQQLNRAEDNPRYSVDVYLLCIAMVLPIAAITFTLLVRFLQRGYFHNAIDWISKRKKTSSTQYGDSQNNTLHTDISHQSNFFHQITHLSHGQSWSLHELDLDSLETEMVTSNISLLTNKLNQYYTMKQNKQYHSMPLMNNQNHDNVDNIKCDSSIILNEKQINIIKNHFHCHSSFDSTTSTGITHNINNIILNNVSAGYWHWIIIIAVLSSVQNGMIPSIASYSLLPYGDIAYIYCITISKMLSPLTALLPLLLPQYLLSTRFMLIATVGWLLTAFYILIIALQSPYPVGVNREDDNPNEFWRFVIVIVSVTCAQLLTVCKTCIYIWIKKSFMSKGHFLVHDILEKALSRIMEIVGISVQVGSFCGAVMFFFLINLTDTFHE